MNENDVLAVFGGLFAFAIFSCMMAVAILLVVAMWKVFTKAGRPGWAAIVPIYNTIVLLEITGRPIWWILLMLIPLVNIVMVCIVYIDLAKSFGNSPGFGVGLLLLPFIFFPILGFGSARYLGPVALPPGPPPGVGPGMAGYPPPPQM